MPIKKPTRTMTAVAAHPIKPKALAGSSPRLKSTVVLPLDGGILAVSAATEADSSIYRAFIPHPSLLVLQFVEGCRSIFLEVSKAKCCRFIRIDVLDLRRPWL